LKTRKPNSGGAIYIATYSRASELDRCIKAIVAARRAREIPLVVIHQQGFKEVSKVIEKWRPSIQVLISLEAQGKSPIENINLNGYLGRELCANWIHADWSLGVEEDVEIAADSIDFIEEMYQKYRNRKDFRGVNLGSKVSYNQSLRNKYTLQRFGMHGQASMITRETWNSFNHEKIMKNVANDGLDGMVEATIKSGFMCTPVLSRYLDNGWNGTHMPKDPESEYYKLLRASFIDNKSGPVNNYKLIDIELNWREDSVKYVAIHNLLWRVRIFLANKRAKLHKRRNAKL
jgi:hypothetical protein